MNKILFSFIFCCLLSRSIFGQNDSLNRYFYNSECFKWVFYDNKSQPTLKQNIDSSWADTLNVKIFNLYFNKKESKLIIKGTLMVPPTASPWTNKAVVIVGSRIDTILKGGSINDYTGVSHCDIPSILFKDYEVSRFYALAKDKLDSFPFECMLTIKPGYNLLLIGKDNCFGLLLDLNKILKDYDR
jgi:hypothetical protein